MTYQRAPDDDYNDDSGEYAAYDDYDDYDDEDVIDAVPPRPRYRRQVAKRGQPQQNVTARRAIDWGTTGGIVTIILLTVLYALSPIDAIPDVIPIAGQADDVVAVAAGTATAGFLAFLRIVLRAMLVSRVGRKGCVILAVVMGAVTILAFIGLAALVNAIV